MNIWWLLVLVVCSVGVVANDHNEKCLDIEAVNPKKYFHWKSRSLPIKLETSSRITHQLSTHLFYIFIKEVLGYSKIEIDVRENDFKVEPVIERLSGYLSASREPASMINLEVWIRLDYDNYMTQSVEECGAVAPPGRFGWFIPAELDIPVRSYHAKHRWTENIQEIHWSLFVDPVMVQNFDISDDLYDKFLENKSKINGTDKYACSNETLCRRGMFIPEYCKHQACATLLAPKFEVSSFLVDQIEDMKLLVKVLWLGDNLKVVLKELRDLYSLERTTQSIVFFSWFPSDIIVDQKDFFSVVFTINEIMNFTRDENVGYKYAMHRLAKLAWSKVEKNAKPLYDSLKNFKLRTEDYGYMLNMYNKNPTMPLRQIACDWLRKNDKTWNRWKNESSTLIYIGGIFPVTATSYNGMGILEGATMATYAINQNKTILANYALKLIIQDGQCKADSVMNHFIDFIVEGYYPQLVGVLGPACSEAVESLAGVSKHYHIMVISYSAEGASFSDRSKYPYFFRTIGENKHYNHVYLYLFKRFGWERVAALSEDGQEYTEYISLMQDDLEKNNIKFIANKKFPRERGTETMTRYLEELKKKRARIIMADVVDDVARAVMCEAYKLKMTAAQGYVWFLPMWLSANWYDTDHFNQNRMETVNCTTQQMIKAINGYFAMTHSYFAPDDAIMQENITVGQWRQKYLKMTPTPSDYAGFAYDAVWTYAFALDTLAKTDPEALSDLHSKNTTNKLMRLVENTDFYGVSGRIKFRGGPSRFSIINIMQWYDNTTYNIGQFYPNLSDNRPEILGGNLKLDVSAVRWFTPDSKIPDDGTPKPPFCRVDFLAKLLDISCNTAWTLSLGTVALASHITFFVVCYYVVKRKYEKLQRTMNYIRALGLSFNMNNTSNVDKWEIPRESVVINCKLGEGAFGTVYGGEANLQDTGWCPVAVKILSHSSTIEKNLDFLSEVNVMKRLNHRNIIKLLGVCTKDEPIYIIMEFMAHRDLKTYLLAHRNVVNKNSNESEEVSPERLTSMALDIARGLSYLAELKYVHRDIAARNCLMNAQRCVKLGDFGMTRAMIDKDYYRFTRDGMLPVRWMSPESLELGVFTTYSDVWSYGVVLYEITTLGGLPFPGKSNAQVAEIVRAGHIMDIPKGVPSQLEELIKCCWNRDSKTRPAASAIVEFLANNTRLLTPCQSLVQLEDSDYIELGVLSEFRKCSTSSKSFSINSGTHTMQTSFDCAANLVT